jgi:hypothetical protein
MIKTNNLQISNSSSKFKVGLPVDIPAQEAQNLGTPMFLQLKL